MTSDEILRILENAKDKNGQIPMSLVRKAFSKLSPAQPQRMHGKWLPDNTCYYETRFACSECHNSECVPTIGFTKYKPIWDFCPNCGADMREEQDNE